MEAIDNLIAQWIELQQAGQVAKAQELYEEELFSYIIERFINEFNHTLQGIDVLFSVLGFTPEPIILTHRVLKPKKHIIFTTPGGYEQAKPLYEKYVNSEPTVIILEDSSFSNIYEEMKGQLEINPARKYALDITGGKKSMVAAASIFGRDFGFNILYVDYEKYLKNIRRPIPGSEILNLVYSPERDLPEAFHNF